MYRSFGVITGKNHTSGWQVIKINCINVNCDGHISLEALFTENSDEAISARNLNGCVKCGCQLNLNRDLLPQ